MKLDLDYDEFDEALKEPDKVTELDLYGDDLMCPDFDIPPEIGQLKNLKKLMISCFGHLTFPKELADLQNLTYLDISENYYGIDFPMQILSLKNLERLELGGTRNIPDQLYMLKKIKHFRLGGIKELPKRTYLMRKLEYLSVSGKIKHFPPKMRELQKLKTLDMSYSDFHSLPKDVCFMPSLEELNITHTFIDELPQEISNLKTLKILKFAKPFKHHGKGHEKTRVLQIRQCWTKLENLEELDLMRQKIIDVSGSVKNWKKLKKIKLCYNDMKELPVEICKIESLEELDLFWNKLETLPKEIGNLKNLKVLKLSRNPITSIPAEIKKLKKLKVLNLQTTYLEQKDIDKLKKLLPKTEIKYIKSKIKL